MNDSAIAGSPSPRQRLAQIAQGMQQDLAAYANLQELLGQQFHAALRHDAAEMERLARQIEQQAQRLEASRQARVGHVQALLPVGAPLSITSLFARLNGGLQAQLLALWAQLEAGVQACKAQNLRNCGLIMQQAETMRHVLTGGMPAQEIYAPR